MYIYIRMYVRVYVTTLRCWCLPLHSRWGMDTQCGRTDPAADAAVAQVSPVLVDIDSSMGESKHPFSHPFFQMQLPAYGPSVNTSQSHVFWGRTATWCDLYAIRQHNSLHRAPHGGALATRQIQTFGRPQSMTLPHHYTTCLTITCQSGLA